VKTYRTTRDLAFEFERMHNVRVKAGVRAHMIPSGTHVSFYVDQRDVETDSARGAGSLWAHDTKYHYIYVPSDAVEEVDGGAQ
jgi:hypothetical protein